MKSQDTVNMAVQVKTVDANKPQSLSVKSDEAHVRTGVIDFVGDIKEELKRISWTSPEELRVYTKIVVGITFFLGMGIYCLDLIIHGALSILNYFFHFIA